MKRLLVTIFGIILIAACLFGVYTGIMSVRDSLDDKEFWEKTGEEALDQIKMLEDGINQLKDNQQTYIEGVKTYEEGLTTYEEGKETLEKGQKLLLCSDGLTGMLETEEIKELLMKEDVSEVCRGLVDAANENGGTDNITVLILVA